MKTFILPLLAVPVLAYGFSAGLRPDLYRRESRDSDFVSRGPNRFIVEVAEGEDVEVVAAELTRSGSKVLKIIQSDIFNAITLETDLENVDTLSSKVPIARAWESQMIHIRTPISHHNYTDEATSEYYGLHEMTGVDRLHKAGITGKGAKVAVIDTGVDYTHPLLGGGFGPKFKVLAGYDFVGDGIWPTEGDKVPDSDPMDYHGHGTHVSGIVAANGEQFKGVAPDAKLLAYKVLTTEGLTDEPTLIEAFLMAYKAGVDVITCSIGGPSGWTSGPWAVVASRIVDKGIVVTIAAGNEGDSGPFYASNGASGEHVLAVASMEASGTPADSFMGLFTLGKSTSKTRLAYMSLSTAWNDDQVKLPIIPLSFDTTITDDGCFPLEGDTRDFSDSIVLVRRGSCSFSDKQANMRALNAKYVMIYSDANRITWPSTDANSDAIAMLTAEDGAAIIKTVQDGGQVIADFTGPRGELVTIPLPYGRAGLPNVYTSMGPTNDLFLKPDIAAPGGNIYSTVPGGLFGIMSGTSMACPYIAGVAALYIGKYGGRNQHGPQFAKDLGMRIIASGNSAGWNDGTGTGKDYGFFAPNPLVGNGLVDAYKVLTYQTSLSPTKFQLNDTRHFDAVQEIKITNHGSKAVTYTFGVQPAGGFDAMTIDPEIDGTPRISYPELELWPNPFSLEPKVRLPSTNSGGFKVKPGETKTAKFTFTPPVPLDPKTLPIYSGKVFINGSNGESLSVPYMGLAADLAKDVGRGVFPKPDEFNAPAMGYMSGSETAPYNTTFNTSLDGWNFEAQDFFVLYAEPKFATAEYRWDIFDGNWKESQWSYPPKVGKKGYVGSATSFNYDIFGAWFFDPAVDDPTNVTPFPRTLLPRPGRYEGTRTLWWLGLLANGTQMAPGKYIHRIAALLPLSDPKRSDSWDILPYHDFQVLKSYE